MDREEEIAEKAIEMYPAGTQNSLQFRVGFSTGVEWADQHPREGLWDSEKVVEWILNNYETYEQTYSDNSGNHTYSDFQIGQFIRNLRKAMED